MLIRTFITSYKIMLIHSDILIAYIYIIILSIYYTTHCYAGVSGRETIGHRPRRSGLKRTGDFTCFSKGCGTSSTCRFHYYILFDRWRESSHYQTFIYVILIKRSNEHKEKFLRPDWMKARWGNSCWFMSRRVGGIFLCVCSNKLVEHFQKNLMTIIPCYSSWKI